MNEELVLKIVAPYVKNNSITYNEFEHLFSMLELKEQYKVLDVLFENKIELSSDEEENNSIENQKYKNYDVFIDSDVNDNLEINMNIKQSNEILCSLVQEGNKQAMQDLCIKNQGLVKYYASKYEKLCGNKLDFEDIEQVGYIGLINATEKFEISKGYAFSTYAVWWIRQAIYREILDKGFSIRIPIHMMEKIMKVQRYEKLLELQEMKYEKQLEIIAKKMGVSVDMVKNCIEIRRKYLDDISLNSYIGEKENMELQEIVIDTENPTVEDIIVENELKNKLNEVMNTLTPREARVLKLRFGLIDGKTRTLEEVGKEYGVTRERIRQIEKKALRKIRHPSRSRYIIDFYEERKIG